MVLPSELFRRNVFISFQEDDLGIQLRSIIGVENLMWGSDYPHAESTFPRSGTIVERILTDVPAREQALIAGENAARLYRFNAPQYRSGTEGWGLCSGKARAVALPGSR
jgi:hypothetical protein